MRCWLWWPPVQAGWVNWEAFMFAAHYGLSNLCVVLDRNHLQIAGTTETVMNSAPLEEKPKAFNFNVVTIDGHDYDQICLLYTSRCV